MTDVTPIPKAAKKPSRTRVGYGTGSKGKATVLHSRLIRARADGRCERCGRTDRALECAHFVSRRFANTRTDEANGAGLCHGCHRYLTENPFEHVVYVTEILGVDGYAALRAKALSRRKMNWPAELERLQALALDLGL